jgi:hypothetical protein
MTIKDYIQMVSDHYSSGSPLPPEYDPDYKDMGYCSALRYLDIQRTPETDAIAQSVIYPQQRKPDRTQAQLSLCFSG